MHNELPTSMIEMLMGVPMFYTVIVEMVTGSISVGVAYTRSSVIKGQYIAEFGDIIGFGHCGGC